MFPPPPAAPARDPRSVAARTELLAGLARAEKHLPCKWFYDRVGSELFEQICELPEYYLTRTELQIMRAAQDEICAALGSHVRLVEFGSGSSTKTRLLLDGLTRPASYVPVDIAADALTAAVAALRRSYPTLPIEPLCRDYSEPFVLPPAPAGTARTVCYFPGSTIGNFEPADAETFLRRVATICGAGGLLLIGADLRKDVGVLLPAYNDAAGVTARFNRNLLAHVGRVFGADIDPENFEHRAIWNGIDGRIEMQLVSRAAQRLTIDGVSVPLRSGEIVTTEYSHKYDLGQFASIAARGGFAVERVWTDPARWFSVQLLRVR